MKFTQLISANKQLRQFVEVFEMEGVDGEGVSPFEYHQGSRLAKLHDQTHSAHV